MYTLLLFFRPVSWICWSYFGLVNSYFLFTIVYVIKKTCWIKNGIMKSNKYGLDCCLDILKKCKVLYKWDYMELNWLVFQTNFLQIHTHTHSRAYIHGRTCKSPPILPLKPNSTLSVHNILEVRTNSPSNLYLYFRI